MSLNISCWRSPALSRPKRIRKVYVRKKVFTGSKIRIPVLTSPRGLKYFDKASAVSYLRATISTSIEISAQEAPKFRRWGKIPSVPRHAQEMFGSLGQLGADVAPTRGARVGYRGARHEVGVKGYFIKLGVKQISSRAETFWILAKLKRTFRKYSLHMREGEKRSRSADLR
ncbi:hypothetical protein B0H12DRAFT_1071481 [Mycena haematopus]|nr:hypothetical protein B0H12DRAFT_1071481 [Mycena haematopus]